MRKHLGRSLLATVLFFGVPSMPFGAISSCAPWAYDVTTGVPLFFLTGACESDWGSLPPSSDEDPLFVLLGGNPRDEAPEPPATEDPAASHSKDKDKPSDSTPIFPLPSESGWRISSPFGPRVDPFTGQPAFHRGVDLAVPEGTPVYAFDGGRVIWAGHAGGYGLAVGIRHGDGRIAWYAHLSSILVAPGSAVRRGEEIGRVGSTGRATGPHLHFEIRQDGRRINPWPELALLLDDAGEEGGDVH